MTHSLRRAGGRTAAALAATALAALLGGCASFSPDGGFATVQQLTEARTGQRPAWQRDPTADPAVQARVAELLAQPLSPEAAVQLALINHRGLQARFAELGIAEAALVRAGRLQGPTLSLGRLAGGGIVELDRALIVDALGLFTLPAAQRAQRAQFEAVQLQAAAEAVALAGEVRQAWYSAVAAQQLSAYAGQVQDAADATRTLAQRLQQAGHFSALQQLREQAFHADAVAQLSRARHQALAERERLARLLGLGADARAFTLPERLPELPAQAVAQPEAEQAALDQRLDLLQARRQADALAQSLGLTRATGWINALDLGVQDQRSTGEPRKRGVELSLDLPWFDFGATRTAQAQARYTQAVHEAADLAGRARSEVREAHSAYTTAYGLARHYRDEVVPLRQRIADEQLLRYNAMLGSVFELLADAREQVVAVTGAVQALRDHWIAATRLQTTLTGRSPAESGALPSPVTTGGAARAADANPH